MAKAQLDVALGPKGERFAVAVVNWLEKRLAGFDDQLAGWVRETPIWRKRDELPRSVPGSGRCATTLLAHLPELGALNRKPISALGRAGAL